MSISEYALRRGRVALSVLALASIAAGCSSTERLFGGGSSSGATSQTASSGSSSSGSSTIGQVRDMFIRKPPEVSPEERAANTRNMAETVCPTVDIRQGTGTLTIPPGGDAMSLRFQGTIGEMARDCQVSAGTMRMKIGIQGRLLVGPAGSAGSLEVPLRYAVVKEGPEPETVVSKFVKVPIAIPEGQQNVAFTHVDNDIAFPMPPNMDIEAYVVYVGFDPVGEKQQPKKPAAKPRR